jgi:hypothetical protein
MTYKTTIVVLWLALVVWGSVLVACEPGTAITIENATDSTVTLFYEPGSNAPPQFTLQPFQTRRLTVTVVEWKDRLIAKDPSGKVIFDQRITLDEMKRMDRIVIKPSQ